MDRLPTLSAAAFFALAACNENTAARDESEQRPGRVDAVLSRANKKTWADVCDVVPPAASALQWPKLNQPVPPQASSKYRWVNVWASWCKPCVEELPLLTETFKSWREHGQGVTLTLVSVDADAESADRFLNGRPGLPPSVRLQDASAAPTWLTELGLGAGTSIPVHLILDAQDQLQCVRAGSIGNRDLEQFQKLLFP